MVKKKKVGTLNLQLISIILEIHFLSQFLTLPGEKLGLDNLSVLFQI